MISLATMTRFDLAKGSYQTIFVEFEYIDSVLNDPKITNKRSLY
jgi:hypothetical protein